MSLAFFRQRFSEVPVSINNLYGDPFLPHSAEKAPTFRYGDESAHQAQLFTKTFLKNK